MSPMESSKTSLNVSKESSKSHLNVYEWSSNISWVQYPKPAWLGVHTIHSISPVIRVGPVIIQLKVYTCIIRVKVDSNNTNHFFLKHFITTHILLNYSIMLKSCNTLSQRRKNNDKFIFAKF